MINYNDLTEEQKKKYKKYCDEHFGETVVFCETGEPLYIDEEGYMIDTKIIIDLLIKTSVLN